MRGSIRAELRRPAAFCDGPSRHLQRPSDPAVDVKVATFINNINRRLPNCCDGWRREAGRRRSAELKSTDADFPIDAITRPATAAVWRGQRTWNGVAILARKAEPC